MTMKDIHVQVMHLLMLNMTGKSYSNELFAFLQVDERLVDIGDDLVDYEVRQQIWCCNPC